MPRGISATGQGHLQQDANEITFCVMENTPIIALTQEYATIYGERVNDAGRLYREMLEWLEYQRTEGRLEPLDQTSPNIRSSAYARYDVIHDIPSPMSASMIMGDIANGRDSSDSYERYDTLTPLTATGIHRRTRAAFPTATINSMSDLHIAIQEVSS